jgi:hypothetical protein
MTLIIEFNKIKRGSSLEKDLQAATTKIIDLILVPCPQLINQPN